MDINDLKNDILNLYKEHCTQFVQANNDIQVADIEKKFVSSDHFKKFNTIVLSTLTKALQAGTIVAKDYDEILNTFQISASEEEIKKLVVADDDPMPTTAAPAGKKWVKEQDKTTNKFTWVLIDAI